MLTVAVVAGLVLGFAAVIVAYNGGAFVMNGPDVTGIHPTPFAVSMVVLALACIVAIIGGAITGLISWIGAQSPPSSMTSRGLSSSWSSGCSAWVSSR